MRRLILAGLALVVGAGGAAGHPLAASAHALLQSSVPGRDALLSISPSALTLTFGEAPDLHLSRVDILDTNGAAQKHGALTADGADPRVLQEPVSPLGRGVYTVSWVTVSVVDGHTAAGTFAFGIGVAQVIEPPSTTPPGGVSSALGVESIVGRFLLYAGLIVLLGSGFIGAVVLRGLPRRLRGVVFVAWVAAAAGVVVVVDAQRRDAGVTVGHLIGTSIGQNLVVRSVVAGLTGCAVLAAVVRPQGSCRSVGVIAGGALVSMVIDVRASHAAAGARSVLNVLLQVVHIGAVGVWIGGITALLIALPGVEPDARGAAIRRFSTGAGVGLVTVATTGVIRAVPGIGSWDHLLTTTYGLLVVAKASLIVVLAGLGALNRYVHVRAADSPAGVLALRRVGSIEVVVGTLAIVLASTLVNATPPSQIVAAPIGAQPLVATGSDDGTTVRVRLEASPGTAGFNGFAAHVTAFDTGAPIADADLSAHFTFAAVTTASGASTLQFKHASGDTYTATGGNLSLDGEWSVLVLVGLGAQSVDVPLHLTTFAAPAKIDVTRNDGLTLYTVHLSVGRTVQVYVDPNRAGPAHVHATYFDATGTGMAVSAFTITQRVAGRPAAKLQPQELDPGHFSSTTTLGSGPATFTMSATTPAGEQLTATLTLTLGE